MELIIYEQEKQLKDFWDRVESMLGVKELSLNWDIYSGKILELIDSNKSKLFERIAEPVKDFIDENVYFIHEEMIPIIDFARDDFTLRLSWDCSADFTDDRNILFSLKEEISDYDGSDMYFERLDRLKIIFKNCMDLVEEKTKQLEEEGVGINQSLFRWS